MAACEFYGYFREGVIGTDVSVFVPWLSSSSQHSYFAD
jgi:hypothetical protein